MKYVTRLCKFSAEVMAEIAKIPEALEEDEVLIKDIEYYYDAIKQRIRGIGNEQNTKRND